MSKLMKISGDISSGLEAVEDFLRKLSLCGSHREMLLRSSLKNEQRKHLANRLFLQLEYQLDIQALSI